MSLDPEDLIEDLIEEEHHEEQTPIEEWFRVLFGLLLVLAVVAGLVVLWLVSE